MTLRADQLPAADWARFSRLLDALLALDAGQRRGWLDTLPDADRDLRPLLIEALDAEARLSVASGAPRLPPDDAAHYAFAAGQIVGPYALERPLGIGGMGEVWLARRHDGSLDRAVALKLPHAWLLSTAQRRRLSRERDFLAGLTHDNIARLYDAGIADDGQPWLALERIEGLRIDHYCRQRRLGLAGRLLLFDQVLDAVEAAHARLIVHRDLKPANILVTEEGRVKLLDFGVAKLLDDARGGEHTELTRLTGRAITPEYAAPEQRAGDAVTPAVDIYSLGVILHELLCGQRPTAPVPGGARPLASQRVLPAHAETVGGLRLPALQRALRGDLDAILAKALAGDPQRRYGSVERFGEDLTRHRRSEPIAARRIGTLESAGRYLRRNRVALGVAAVLLISIGGGAWASLSQAERAMREAQRANATRDFLLRMLAAGSRLQAQDREPGALTVREMIDRIVDGADTDLADQPETRLELLGIAKSVYRQWYQRERAFAAHEQYRQLVEQQVGANDPRIIESLIEQASIYSEYADPPIGRAELLSEASVRIRRAGLEGSLLDAQRLTEIGRDLTPAVGGSAAAIDALQRAVDIHDRLNSGHRTRVWASHYLAQALIADARLDRARTVLEAALARARALPKGQRNDWSIACLLIERGHLERADGDAEAAGRAYDEGLQLALATFGREIDNVQLALGWKATLLDWQGQHEAADAMFAREAAALADALAVTEAGDSNEGPAWFYLLHARHLLARGRPADALPMLEKASVIETTTQPAPFTRADALVALGDALTALGRDDEAGRPYRAAVEIHALYGQPQVDGALEARLRWIQHRVRRRLLTPVDAAAELDALLVTAAKRAGPVIAEAAIERAELAWADGDAAAAAPFADRAARALDDHRALVDPRRLAALRARLAARAG